MQSDCGKFSAFEYEVKLLAVTAKIGGAHQWAAKMTAGSVLGRIRNLVTVGQCGDEIVPFKQRFGFRRQDNGEGFLFLVRRTLADCVERLDQCAVGHGDLGSVRDLLIGRRRSHQETNTSETDNNQHIQAVLTITHKRHDVWALRGKFDLQLDCASFKFIKYTYGLYSKFLSNQLKSIAP